MAKRCTIVDMLKPLTLALLGNPEVRLAGQPLAGFRSAKAYGLLYYLATNQQEQPRSLLAGLFWGDVGDYYARRNLNRTVSNLRQLVGDHLLITRHTLAFAQAAPGWVDVQLLDAAVTSVPTAETIATLSATADLYRGDFLNGFYVHDAPEFEQWVLVERDRLRSSALQLRQALATYYSAQGDLPAAIMHTRSQVQLAPWHEEAHCRLMLLLAQDGQRSAALAQFERCCQALRSELDVEPAAATLALVARIRNGEVVVAAPKIVVSTRSTALSTERTRPDPSTQAPAPPHTLPGQRTPFIGRAAELADITRLLLEDEDCRLLTLIGPGGMGKTRLALQAAAQIHATPTLPRRFADGIFFVPLEHVGDLSGIVGAMMAALGTENTFTRQGQRTVAEQLIYDLRSKAMLLILDNFEHLIPHTDFCSALLAGAPNLKLLVTSRESLALQEAWFYPLLGLAMPRAHDPRGLGQADSDAVRLFAQCARRANPAFVLEAELAAVMHICTLVEGMPLGIELAAAWRKVMSCTQIAHEVAQGLDFLTARYQNIPPRHRSMRAVMDHSWALLSVEEQDAIARLAIFRGRFQQAAATVIAGASLLTMAALVEKALVRITPDGFYQLHELTRQYAETKLGEEEKERLRDAHAHYYAALVDRQRPLLFTAAYRTVWSTVGGEFDNIQQGWQWILANVESARSQLSTAILLRQMAEVLARYYLAHALWLAGEALFADACERLSRAGWLAADTPGVHEQLATLLHLQSNLVLFHLELGRYRASLALSEKTLAGCRIVDQPEDLCAVLLVYGQTQVRRGARNEAVLLFQEAQALGEALQMPRYVAEALIGLGLTASGRGAYSAAQEYYHHALALCQAMGYRPWIARLLMNLGTTYSRQELYAQAEVHYEEALAMALEIGDQNLIMINTSNLGGVYRGIGRHPLALEYYQRSLAMARTIGEERWIAANLNGLALTHLAVGDLAATDEVLREAVVVGQRCDSLPDLLGSIGLMGHLLARRGHLNRALALLQFVEAHPATMARDHHYSQALLAELRSELPSAVIAEASQWAAEQALDGIVRWLLYRALP